MEITAQVNCSDIERRWEGDGMPFELKTDAKGTTMMLTGKLGVRQVRALWDAVQAAVAGGTAIRLEATELEEMDTSIVQLLCRLSRTGRLQIGGVSDGFLVSLQRRGLEKFFIQPRAPRETKVQILRPKLAKEVKTIATPRTPRRRHA
jgi:ABC-type transporter Mla MlaB component